jgi:hypothetical protein
MPVPQQRRAWPCRWGAHQQQHWHPHGLRPPQLLLLRLVRRCLHAPPPRAPARRSRRISLRSPASQHTSAYVSTRQRMSAYVSVCQHTSDKRKLRALAAFIRARLQVSIRQRMSAYVWHTQAARSRRISSRSPASTRSARLYDVVARASSWYILATSICYYATSIC